LRPETAITGYIATVVIGIDAITRQHRYKPDVAPFRIFAHLIGKYYAWINDGAPIKVTVIECRSDGSQHVRGVQYYHPEGRYVRLHKKIERPPASPTRSQEWLIEKEARNDPELAAIAGKEI
jgi:hypothetical protein